ncbi:hypothetical protein JW949_02135 [Candidatus Woesearchaeota archaeon]|nr:hypothetical protein [Candidatus Woesearchaeota archaeon]
MTCDRYGRQTDFFEDKEKRLIKKKINNKKKKIFINYGKKYIKQFVKQSYEVQQIKDTFLEYIKIINKELEEYSGTGLGGIEEKIIKDQIVDTMYKSLINILQIELGENFEEFLKSIGNKYFSKQMNKPPSEGFEKRVNALNRIRRINYSN